MRRAALALAAALSAALSAVPACVGVIYSPAVASRLPTPTPADAAVRGPLRAGARHVDITPAPGFSILGHGPEGRVTSGTLLRLRCQPIVLRQELEHQGVRREEVLALVPCDLGWSSLLLSRAVARELERRSIPIGADRLVLSATHTHGGPGHYLGPANYAGIMSSEKPGYSPSMVEFLAKRIAEGIAGAYEDAANQPVRATWRKWSFHDGEPSARTRDAGTSAIATFIGKNRAMDAFSRDTLSPEEQARFLDPRRTAVPDAARPALYAVEGSFAVLRIDRDLGATFMPLAAYAVVGVHPTAISNLNDLYHGDLFGFASRAVEARVRDEVGPEVGADFVVGIANGVEGDVSPLIDFPGPREARRLGAVLGKQIHHLWEEAGPTVCAEPPPKSTSDPEHALRVAYRELELRGARASADNTFHQLWTSAGWDPSPPHATLAGDPVLCDNARLGTAASGGAEDGRTFFMSLPDFREGAVAPRSTSCHAPKLELVPPADGPTAFPTRAPIFAFEVAGELVTTFPGEVTTLAGFRARRQLERYLHAIDNDSARRVAEAEIVEVGLTGEYLQYMTTAAEYGAQEYEGASSLYGPNEARFFANQLLCLSRFLYEDVSERSDAECALDHGTGAVREPQPRVGEVAPVTFEPGGTARGGDPEAVCSNSPPSGRSAFAPADALEGRRSRVNKLVDPVCGAEIYPLARDGEHGYGVTYYPVPHCGKHEQPRVAIVAAEGETVLDDDDGDGMEIRWVEGTWRIAWYPDAGVRGVVGDRKFQFRAAPSPGHEERSATGSICSAVDYDLVFWRGAPHPRGGGLGQARRRRRR
ncbi:MAG: neutral/alkaline non-lysosomal ceramidase N-terminal domain-containing protein [Polyangiaceae bacterium]